MAENEPLQTKLEFLDRALVIDVSPVTSWESDSPVLLAAFRAGIQAVHLFIKHTSMVKLEALHQVEWRKVNLKAYRDISTKQTLRFVLGPSSTKLSPSQWTSLLALDD